MRMKSPYHDFTTPDECGMIENVMNLAGGNVFPKDEYYAPNQYDITTCKLLIYPGQPSFYSLFVDQNTCIVHPNIYLLLIVLFCVRFLSCDTFFVLLLRGQLSSIE